MSIFVGLLACMICLAFAIFSLLMGASWLQAVLVLYGVANGAFIALLFYANWQRAPHDQDRD